MQFFCGSLIQKPRTTRAPQGPVSGSVQLSINTKLSLRKRLPLRNSACSSGLLRDRVKGGGGGENEEEFSWVCFPALIEVDVDAGDDDDDDDGGGGAEEFMMNTCSETSFSEVLIYTFTYKQHFTVFQFN